MGIRYFAFLLSIGSNSSGCGRCIRQIPAGSVLGSGTAAQITADAV